MVASDEVVDDVRVPKAFGDLMFIAEVPLLLDRATKTARQRLSAHEPANNGDNGESTHQRDNLAKIAHDAQETRLVGKAVRHDDLGALLGCVRVKNER